jgi:hypothetical protein
MVHKHEELRSAPFPSVILPALTVGVVFVSDTMGHSSSKCSSTFHPENVLLGRIIVILRDFEDQKD